MRENNTISDAVIKRLPRYYRCLSELAEQGEERISSGAMSEILGFTASQVRQDLNNFGGFGQQGYGYDVAYLLHEIEKILGLTREYEMIVLGAGNIGRALIHYAGFRERGFRVRAAFDTAIVGEFVKDGVEYYAAGRLEDYAARRRVDIAALCVPKEQAQAACDRLISLGITAIWNFAPRDLRHPAGVTVENINMSESLYTLSYRINHPEGGKSHE